MPDDGTLTPTAPAGDPNASTFEAITSQEALDAIVQKRLGRERAKYEPLEAQVADLTSQLAQAGTATTDLSTAQDRIKDLETQLAAAQGDTLRAAVAAEKGVPAALLTGTTQEELEQSAQGLLDYAAAQVPNGTYVPTEGRSNRNPTVDAKRELARKLFGRDDAE